MAHLPDAAQLGALEELGGAAVREELTLDDAQLLERVLGVDLLRLVRVLVLVLQLGGDLPRESRGGYPAACEGWVAAGVLACVACVEGGAGSSLVATCRSFSVSMRNLKSVRSWHTMSTAMG